MNLTVAMRVIAGFVIINFLLIILGVFSLISLNSIDNATDEVSNIALPTVSGSSNLKASFLNMGRLTFEAYLTESKEALNEQRQAFNVSSASFEKEMAKLQTIAQQSTSIKQPMQAVDKLYSDYHQNANAVYDNHLETLSARNVIADMVASLEENSDDASSLLLDFTDLDEIADSTALTNAAQLVGSLESNILSLLTSVTEYVATETFQRAEIRSQEVEVMLKQTQTRFSEFAAAANGQDNSGTVDEVQELIERVVDEVTGSNGILAMHKRRLNYIVEASAALDRSDENIRVGQLELNKLLDIANDKAYSIKQSISTEVTSSAFTVVVVILVSVAIGAFIAYRSVLSISVPLQKVNKLLQIASSGDLTHRLDDSSSDEFGELAKNCNNLIDSLKGLIAGINQRAGQLAAVSGQTSTITAQTTLSIQEQKSQISQIATATTEMHSTSELVSQSADDTLKEIRYADSEAEKVKGISIDNKRTIEVLARDVQEAADVINKLHQDSASIGGILDVIRGVADQTNLLALNAAIEAARAGEQGRGFAVVADEVRTLASRTQESTQEINAMIEVLQAGAEKAVTVMTQGKQQTVACVEQTETATQALNLITDAVHRAHEVSSRIEQAAREQHTVSAEISEKLESIVGIAEETTLGAQQTTESSAEVAKLADELQESIGRFKV